MAAATTVAGRVYSAGVPYLCKTHEVRFSEPQRVPCATIVKRGLSTMGRATNRLYVATLQNVWSSLRILPGAVTLFLDTVEPARTER